MDKISQLADYFAQYGYYAIFICVFLQEIGIPNPITNEFVLIFCGYLSYKGSLNIYEVILVAVSADFIGTILLFFVFYFFSKWLIDHSPKWLPLTGDKIEILKKRVLRNGQRSIFMGRMTPFVRGYVSVAAGMLNVGHKAFIGTVIVSAIIWNAGLVVLGRLIGPYWNIMLKESGVIEKVVLIIVLIAVILFIGRYFKRKQLERDVE
ncbi:MAG TPA: DedA family protein [Bacteroidia bacterium]|jgi:membrane protein DedA with SNARE-associated domain|nr:DedA family protein [Bacteroidia bacterium]